MTRYTAFGFASRPSFINRWLNGIFTAAFASIAAQAQSDAMQTQLKLEREAAMRQWRARTPHLTQSP